ncbi:unnamed protein product [Acanthoscelides obtectus]|uniref:Uncharacterized protein n=1 Tax=Acanthoscelides obtectus TaxID=200917 RepID=A0A9P0LUT0_ACAOB|nr:unnamed protein product [Acanthoscelides obtectus]CAK1668578.1 hypothetical protein AOBTE_LOCUS26498 [Acanthoscelides obtectus]
MDDAANLNPWPNEFKVFESPSGLILPILPLNEFLVNLCYDFSYLQTQPPIPSDECSAKIDNIEVPNTVYSPFYSWSNLVNQQTELEAARGSVKQHLLFYQSLGTKSSPSPSTSWEGMDEVMDEVLEKCNSSTTEEDSYSSTKTAILMKCNRKFNGTLNYDDTSLSNYNFEKPKEIEFIKCWQQLSNFIINETFEYNLEMPPQMYAKI